MQLINLQNIQSFQIFQRSNERTVLLRLLVPPKPTLGYWLDPVKEPATLVGTTIGTGVVVMPTCGGRGGAGVGYLLQSGTRQQASLGSVTRRQELGKLLKILHLEHTSCNQQTVD